jgi:tetratricopeptide (TPR) repeat protein
MAKKNKKHEVSEEKQVVHFEKSKSEEILTRILKWVAGNRKLIGLSFLGAVFIIGGYLTFKQIRLAKKYKIATSFFNVNKEYAEKIKKQQFDLNSVGNTMKKLREITEKSKRIEETLLARFYLGILHYNVGRSENKNQQYITAIKYFREVAQIRSFEFAPQALLSIGACYEELSLPRFYKRAIEFYDTAIKRYSSTIFAYRAFYKKGLCYMKLNQRAQAIDAFSKIPRYIGSDAASKRENLLYTMANYYTNMLKSQS